MENASEQDLEAGEVFAKEVENIIATNKPPPSKTSFFLTPTLPDSRRYQPHRRRLGPMEGGDVQNGDIATGQKVTAIVSHPTRAARGHTSR